MAVFGGRRAFVITELAYEDEVGALEWIEADAKPILLGDLTSLLV